MVYNSFIIVLLHCNKVFGSHVFVNVNNMVQSVSWRFAHLINLEFFDDLLAVLYGLIISGVSISTRISCFMICQCKMYALTFLHFPSPRIWRIVRAFIAFSPPSTSSQDKVSTATALVSQTSCPRWANIRVFNRWRPQHRPFEILQPLIQNPADAARR